MNDGVVVLVDGANMLMRCIKAMEYSGLRGGQTDWKTGPLTAFIGSLTRITKNYPPDYLVVCWDDGPSVRRMDAYPAYKEKRKELTPEQQERKDDAFTMVKTFLSAAGVEQASLSGFEADDMIAAYWARQDEMNWPKVEMILIVSGDKDFLQLVGWNPQGVPTAQLRPDGQGAYLEWTLRSVKEKYGCTPDQLPLLMALMGDQSDGVPGVRGLGPKKALKALQNADWSLEEMTGTTAVLKTPEDVLNAHTSLALVDLRNQAYHPPLLPLEPFRPVTVRDTAEALEFVTFLKSLEMETVISRFYTETLWR